MLDARYDWRVDGPPVQQGFAELGDVSCSIEVSVEAEPTLLTLEYASVPVPSFDVSANATFLAGVSWIHKNNAFSTSFRFVCKKSLELTETPVSKKPIESPAVCFRSLYFQVFQSEGVCVRFNNPFAKAVIDVSDKPVFPSAEAFQMSFCGTGAFCLETTLQPLVFAFHSPYLTAVEELTITGDYRIGYSPVNTNNIFRLHNRGGFGFGVEVQKYLGILVAQGRTSDMPPNVTFEVNWDVDWNFDTPTDGGKGNNFLFKFGGERSGVVSYSATKFFCRQSFQSFPLQHVGSLVAGGTNETGLEAGELFPNLFVGEVMDFEFVEGLRFKRHFEDIVTGFVVALDCIDKSFVVAEPKFYSSLHNYSLEHKIFKPIGLVMFMEKVTSSAVYNINYHFVWCPKYRKPILKGEVASALRQLLETICRTKNWDLLELEIRPDHIHLFLSAPPYESPIGIIKILKGISAIQLFKALPQLRQQLRKGHLWSPSYYVGTAGNVSAATIQKYIQNQQEGRRDSSTL